MKLINYEGLKAKGIHYSRTQLWRLIKAKKFPAPVKVGPGRNAWVDTEIDAYIEEKIAERDAEAA